MSRRKESILLKDAVSLIQDLRNEDETDPTSASMDAIRTIVRLFSNQQTASSVQCPTDALNALLVNWRAHGIEQWISEFDNEWTLDPETLNDGDFKMFHLLMSYKVPGVTSKNRFYHYVWPSNQLLSNLSGVTERTVRRRLSNLRKMGFIVTHPFLKERAKETGHDVPDDSPKVWAIRLGCLPRRNLT